MDIAKENARAYDEHAQEWDASMPNNFAHLYLEKPAMSRRIPEDLERKDILCVGVGAGDELGELVLRNPRRIVGIDISEKLLAIAKKKFASLETYIMDMQELEFPDGAFDFVYSSLAFHYSKDWDELLSGMYRVLKPGGTLLFSTHHPDYWGNKPATGNSFINSRGVTVTEHTAVLPGNVSITYYNQADVEAICSAVKHAGFQVVEYLAPEVIKPQILHGKEAHERYDSLVKKNSSTPLFLVVLARKP